jgi:hypothetical protein
LGTLVNQAHPHDPGARRRLTASRVAPVSAILARVTTTALAFINAMSWWRSDQSIPQLMCTRLSSSDAMDIRAQGLRSTLMDSARGATPHQLAADPAAGGATVYMKTSTEVGDV